jgi:hypothetical protein
MKDPTHTATEMARLSRKLTNPYIAVKCNGEKNCRCTNERGADL